MTPVSKTHDILALGEAMIEFNQTEPGKPNYLQGFGGDSSNFAIAAARQGARVAYVSALGDDPYGRMLRALNQLSVNLFAFTRGDRSVSHERHSRGARGGRCLERGSWRLDYLATGVRGRCSCRKRVIVE